MTQIKGSLILGSFKYIKEVTGSPGLATVLEEVAPQHREPFGNRVLASSWYPYSAYAALLEATDRVIGADDYSEMPKLGRFAAVQDFSTILKVLRIFSSPEALLDRATFFWHRYCDTGSSELISKSKGQALMALKGFPDVSPYHCRLLSGWIAEISDQVGGKNSRVEKVACVHDGAEWCEYEGRWD